MGLQAQPGGIIVVLRMPQTYMDFNMSICKAVIEVTSLLMSLPACGL